jgi:signal recognition particle receptor subunit beta
MAIVDDKKKLLQCKIVYYGAGLGGKTTNLRTAHKKTDPKRRGKLLTLETESKPPLFFDFAPLSTGKIKGHETRFSFYTVPGHSYDNLTRKALIRDVDGVVMVCDSQKDRMEANIDSFMNLEENLLEYKHKLNELPHVIQYNKRDLEDIVPVAEMRKELNRYNAPDFEAIAIQGQGVLETLEAIVRMVTEKVTIDLGL